MVLSTLHGVIVCLQHEIFLHAFFGLFLFRVSRLSSTVRVMVTHYNLFQTLPLNATVSLPHLLLSKERIDFGVSLVGRVKEMSVKLTNLGKSASCWFVEKGKDALHIKINNLCEA